MLTAKPNLRGYTVKDLHKCAEREANRRRNRFPNHVLTHRMSQRQADSEIDKMAAIAEVLAEMAEKDRLL